MKAFVSTFWSRFSAAVLAFVVLQLLPVSANACSVCFADAESPMGKAANGAIGMMLLLVAFVLGSFILFIVHLARHARKVASTGEGPSVAPTSTSEKGLH